MYRYIQISCIKNNVSKDKKICRTIEEAIQYINTKEYEITQTITDAAGNVTGFLIKKT